MKFNKEGVSVPRWLTKPSVYMPLLVAFLLIVVAIGVTMQSDPGMGFILIFFLLICIILVVVALFAVDKVQNDEVNDLTDSIDTVENEILLEIPLGIIIFNEDDTIRWMNPYLQNYIGNKDVLGQNLEDVDTTLADMYSKLRENQEATYSQEQWGDHYFDIGLLKDLRAMYMLDVTEYGQIAKLADDNRITIGYILVDNYDETVGSITDRRKSSYDNFIIKQLSAWSKKYKSFVKKLDDDRYLLVSTREQLRKMENDKFSVIDDVRETTTKTNLPLTISMGISYQEQEEEIDIDEISNEAQSNLDLAQSRGGDQVVIKTKQQKARYYGGKTNPMEKRTHVRSRQIATTIANMMQNNDSIYVMGHDYPDMDAIGACVGIRRIAQMNGRKCHIVINEDRINDDIRKLMVELRKDDDIAEAIISPKEAEDSIQPTSLLFLVDHHRPTISTDPDLIDMVNGVVIIDHHRKGEDVPDNIMLEYIEPYASSTCELITEFFEYQNPEAESINRIEATTMLAGIVVDSRSFSLRTGSRTFDAASYLKSCGADSILIQDLLKEDLSDYVDRSHLIENVQFFEPDIGISVGEDDVAYSTVTAAQAADGLLSMNNISQSYVVFLRQDGRVGISARSMGNVNVQTVMEEMGGGGHLSNAATQLSDCTVHEAADQLKSILKKRNEEESE